MYTGVVLDIRVEATHRKTFQLIMRGGRASEIENGNIKRSDTKFKKLGYQYFMLNKYVKIFTNRKQFVIEVTE